jgi:hypothetical protein
LFGQLTQAELNQQPGLLIAFTIAQEFTEVCTIHDDI